MSRRHSLLFACAALLPFAVRPAIVRAQTAPPTVAAPAPTLMNFQGKLAKPDGTPVADGMYSVQFTFYDALTGGNQLWTQTLSTINVHNGAFAALLTVDTPNLFNGNLWLELKVGTDAPLAPRQQIVSVAYAQKANTVPDGSITGAKIAAGSITADKFSITFGGVPSGYSILGPTPAAPAGYTYSGQTIATGVPLDAWTTKSPLPVVNSGGYPISVVALNNRLYLFGASTTTDSIYAAASYDPLTDTYAPLPNAPYQLSGGNAAAAALNGKIYYLAGNNTLVYDPVASVWVTNATNPYYLGGNNACAALNGKLYAISTSSAYQPYTQSSLSVYDPTAKVWTPLPSMPTPRLAFAIATFNNKIYTFGGYTVVNGVQTPSAAAQVYDPAANTWAILPNLPTALSYPGAAVLNNKIYILGGNAAPSNMAPVISGINVEYDPTAGTYATKASLLTPRWRVGAASLFNTVYTFGGLTATGARSFVNEAYTPSQFYYVHTKN